jgi:uncharacterized membrane protein YfcA
MMLVTAIAMLRRRRQPDPVPDVRRTRAPLPLILAEGLGVGAVTGLVGAGGGFLVVPALIFLGGLPMAEAVATSLLVIAMKSFAAFAGSAADVHVDVPMIAMITAAAIVGSVAGSALTRRISGERLQRIFGWFIVAMAVFVLAQELPTLLGGVVLGRDWPWLAGIVAVAVLSAATVIIRRVRAISALRAVP